MAYSRLSMRKIFEVLRLSVADGRSHREIARAIIASPTTVGEILRRAKLAGLTYPLPSGLSEAAVEALLYPPSAPSKRFVRESRTAGCAASANATSERMPTASRTIMPPRTIRGRPMASRVGCMA